MLYTYCVHIVHIYYLYMSNKFVIKLNKKFNKIIYNIIVWCVFNLNMLRCTMDIHYYQF